MLNPQVKVNPDRLRIPALASSGRAAVALLLACTAACRREQDPQEAVSPVVAADAAAVAHEGLLHGRVTMHNNTVYEGRIRFGGDEETLWGNYFNGRKDENPWAEHVPPDQLPRQSESISIFGVRIAGFEREAPLNRPIMARFGDIARLDANGRDLWVRLKSGTEFHLDRYAADDFADGLRVWDATQGVVDLDEWGVRTIEFSAPPPPDTTGRATLAADPLHGTVRTSNGSFTGFIQWNRKQGLLSDELVGYNIEGQLTFRFGDIRSMARRSPDSILVSLADGRNLTVTGSTELTTGGARDVPLAERGMYVDDPRYGRVLVSWEAFERVDFSSGGTGPAYGDFPKGSPLSGSVTTRSGRRLTGRLVYDLDESETTETLDAPSQGVDYTLLFGLIASIVLPSPDAPATERASVRLHSGEQLQLDRSGDLSASNAGMLIFSDGGQRAEYVPWSDVAQIEFDRPAEMYPPGVSR